MEAPEWNTIMDYMDLWIQLAIDFTKINIKAIFEQVPDDCIGLKNDLIKLILETEKIGRRDLNKIIKEMEVQPNGVPYNPDDLDGDRIPFNNDEILISNTNNSIYLLSSGRPPIIICHHNIGLISKVFDPRQDQELYKWTLDGIEFSGFTLNEIIRELGYKILNGRKGIDVIVHLIEIIALTLPMRDVKYIVGWDNGWYLPMSEEDKGFEIIHYANQQRTVYNNLKDMYIEYTGGEKEELKKKLNEFVKLTDMPEAFKTIIISFCMVMPFRLYFINGKFKFFPNLALYGRTTAGKTTLVKAFSTDFYGNYKKDLAGATALSPSQTEVALTNSTFGVLIDEMATLNEYQKGRMSATIKSISTSSPYWLRNKRDGRGNVYREMVSSILTTTQVLGLLFHESAQLSRNIGLYRDESIEDNPLWAKYAIEIKNERPFSLLYDETKDWTDIEFGILVEKAKKYYGKSLETVMTRQNDIKYPRLLKTYIIILVGCYIAKKYYGMTLKIKGVWKILVESRKEVVNDFLQIFLCYCEFAIKYDYERPKPRQFNERLYYDKENKKIIFMTLNLPDLNNYHNGYINERIKFNTVLLFERLFDALDHKNLIKFDKNYRHKGKKARAIIINPVLLCNGDVKPIKLREEIAHNRIIDLIANIKAPYQMLSEEELKKADEADNEMEKELGLSEGEYYSDGKVEDTVDPYEELDIEEDPEIYDPTDH